ncbi:MAG: hypothetical protein IJU46_06060 [Clostridia bacterium]|nr:hypothetical protein [Clostridia bacterium]
MKVRTIRAALCRWGSLAACALMILSGCGPEVPDVTTGAEDTTAAAVTVAPRFPMALMEGGKSVCPVVRGDRADELTVAAAMDFNRRFTELTGSRLDIRTDYLKPGETADGDAREILIGDTNRPESASAAEGLEAGCFRIRTAGRKIVICASRPELLEKALDCFFGVILADAGTAEAGSGYARVLSDIDYTSEKISLLYETLSAGGTFSSVCSEMITVPLPEDGFYPQGGCSDGRYYYQGFVKRDYVNNEKDNIDRIVKVEMATGRVVKVSGDLSLNHCNDLSYIPDTGQLAVVHNNPNRTYVSFIDAEELTFITTKKLTFTIYCLDYQPAAGRYVIGLSGGQNFRFLNEDLKMGEYTAVHNSTPSTSGYTTQGCASDANFIYFVLYNKNVITVYDWDGDFVGVIELDVGNIEPENISVVDDTIYVGCAKNGMTLFKVIPKLKTE